MVEIAVINNTLHLCKTLRKETYCEKTKKENKEIEKELLSTPTKLENLKIKALTDYDLQICEECFNKNQKVQNKLKNIIILFIFLISSSFLLLIYFKLLYR